MLFETLLVSEIQPPIIIEGRFGMKIKIPISNDYSFSLTSKRLIEFEKTSYRYKDGKLWRSIRLSHQSLVMGVGLGDSNHLEIETSCKLSSEEQVELKSLIQFVWSTNLDLSPFYQQAEGDPVLGPIVMERRGLHRVLDPNLYECLIRTIISQQLNTAFASTLIHRLLDLTGEKIPYQDDWYPVFPTPEQLAELSVDDLTALQMNQRKAEYIIGVSKAIVDGSLRLDEWRKHTDEEIIKNLTKFRGIGRWTAECLLLFGYGREDLLPAADIGIRNAIQVLFGQEEKPSEEEIRKLGVNWSPYSSYYTLYLWDYLTDVKQANKQRASKK